MWCGPNMSSFSKLSRRKINSTAPKRTIFNIAKKGYCYVDKSVVNILQTKLLVLTTTLLLFLCFPNTTFCVLNKFIYHYILWIKHRFCAVTNDFCSFDKLFCICNKYLYFLLRWLFFYSVHILYPFLSQKLSFDTETNFLFYQQFIPQQNIFF